MIIYWLDLKSRMFKVSHVQEGLIWEWGPGVGGLSSFSVVMEWTNNHNLALAREVLLL